VFPYRKSPNQDNIGIEMPNTDGGFIKQGGKVTGGKCKARQKVMMLKGNAVQNHGFISIGLFVYSY
jgi:hypothetical protein